MHTVLHYGNALSLNMTFTITIKRVKALWDPSVEKLSLTLAWAGFGWFNSCTGGQGLLPPLILLQLWGVTEGDFPLEATARM